MRVLPIFSSLVLAFIACAACADNTEPTSTATRAASSAPTLTSRPSDVSTGKKGPLVLFLGDSLSAGLHLDADQAFPAVLQRLLAAEDVSFRLQNAGSSGDTTAGGLRRLDWLLKQAPDWVVVELGGNDGLRGIPIESIESNLSQIVQQSKAQGAQVILLGMKLPPNYGPDYTTEFEAMYARVARVHELVFVPFFLEGVGGVPELNLEDGIHPTAEGHRLIAEGLVPVFRDLAW